MKVTQPETTVLPDGSVRVRFPYNADVVAAIKDTVPWQFRTYDPGDKSWTVEAPWGTELIRIMRMYFDDAGISRPSAGAADHYAVLYVLPNAPASVIKAVYRCLVKENHPDLFPEDERERATERMQLINAAYVAVGGGE